MDDIRAEIWGAVRHLFPENAVAVPLQQGDLLVSWKTLDDPGRPNKRSTPIYLRFEASLLENIRGSDPAGRERFMAREIETVKAGMRGYQTHDPLQKARFIVLG